MSRGAMPGLRRPAGARRSGIGTVGSGPDAFPDLRWFGNTADWLAAAATAGQPRDIQGCSNGLEGEWVERASRTP
jgi:hypothetical protein